MAAITFPERVAQRAASISIAKILLTILAAPFYAVGLLVGVLWVAAAWAVSAGMLGVEDMRSRSGRRGDV
jgi:hypothetical protein